MKSIFFSSVLLVLFAFSCSNDDDGGMTPTDLTIQIVGTYSGQLDIQSMSGNITASGPESITISKTANDRISIVVFESDGFWDDLTIAATMTSATAFTLDNTSWEGFTFGGSGTLSGSMITINFASGGTGSYVGTK